MTEFMAQTKDQMVRELEIERTLDLVRTAAFSMADPDDLKTVANALFEAFETLGFGLFRCSLDFIDEANDHVDMWVAAEGDIRVHSFQWSTWLETVPEADDKKLDFIDAMRMKQMGHHQWTSTRRMYEVIAPVIGMDRETTERILADTPDPLHDYYIPLSRSMDTLQLALGRSFSEDELDIAQRFADVFDFAYTRYLELKRLADQNRELQVEASLEHVRARALGMQTSDELSDVAVAFFDAFQSVGIDVRRPALATIDAETDMAALWTTSSDGEPIVNPPLPLDLWRTSGIEPVEALPRGFSDRMREPLRYEWTRSEYASFLEWLEDQIGLDLPDYRQEGIPETSHWLTHFFDNGYIILNTRDVRLSDEEAKIVRRFVDVFDFAYDRFLELKRLEIQNRELQVEGALEHVRARALGMQSSVEIPDVVEALFTQITVLGLPVWRTGIAFFTHEDGDGTWWLTSGKGDILDRASFKMSTWMENPILSGVYRAWEQGASNHQVPIHGQVAPDLANWVRHHLGLNVQEYDDLSEKVIEEMRIETMFIRFDDGMLYLAVTDKVDEEDVTVLERFAGVFGFAYSRMQELTLAEEQAQQAERRAAIDHIRAEIAAMQTTEDFERVTPLLWQTLNVLGVPFIRCGFTIHDRETESLHMYLSDADGNPMAVITSRIDKHDYLRKAWDRWMEGEMYVEPFTRDEFVQLQLAIQTGLESLEGDRYVMPESLPDQLVSHMVPFSHGTLYVNSTEHLSREDLAFVGDLAGAFSVAYARYQDFRQLERQNEDLEEASRVKSRFLANMSHELRTPMNAIIGFTQIVLRRGSEGLSDRHRGNLEKVKQSADHLLALINDVLDLSKIEANKMDLRAERFIVEDLVSASCATVSPLVKGGVTLSYEVADEVKEAYQDAGRLRQVLINLLSNALKFTDEGSVEVKVGRETGSSEGQDGRETGSSEGQDGRKAESSEGQDGREAGSAGVRDDLVISVSDTGVGIPEEDLEGIFQEFQQVDGEVTRKQQGTGLGLSICRMLTELMGGGVRVESEVGEGSVFTVWVPVEYGGVSDDRRET
jgi:signal transduction histidine kinase